MWSQKTPNKSLAKVNEFTVHGIALLLVSAYTCITITSWSSMKPCLSWYSSHLLPADDLSLGYDDDFAVLLEGHDLCHTVGVTGVVDVAGRAASHGGIHNSVIIDPEHVHATILKITNKCSFHTLYTLYIYIIFTIHTLYSKELRNIFFFMTWNRTVIEYPGIDNYSNSGVNPILESHILNTGQPWCPVA